VSQQPRLDVLRGQGLGQQGIGQEVDLPDGQVVRRPPVGVQRAQFLLVEVFGVVGGVERVGRGPSGMTNPS
jgi:hypothetical protein